MKTHQHHDTMTSSNYAQTSWYYLPTYLPSRCRSGLHVVDPLPVTTESSFSNRTILPFTTN